MRERNPEILSLQVALQDLAEFEIVIHYKQVRLDLLRLLARNFLFACTRCAFIVHEGSDESLFNQGRPV
jgi:hypothetical protein